MKETKKPIVDVGGGLESYIAAGDENTRELLASDAPVIAALKQFDAFFRDGLWREPVLSNPLAFLLFTNAYMLFLSGARMALTGHAAAIYPLLRTALESACYGFLIERKPDLADVWTQRHQSKAQYDACRNAFTVAKANKLIRPVSADIGNLVEGIYDAAIDFGGHPNIKGVIQHVTMDQDRDDGMVAVNLAGLHGTGGTETTRALVACLDFGLAIAAVIVLGPETPSKALVTKLQELSDLKNAVADELQADPDAAS